MKQWFARHWFGPRDAALVTFARWVWAGTMVLEFFGLGYEHYQLRHTHFTVPFDGFQWVPWLGLPGMWALDFLGLAAAVACMAGWRWRATGAVALVCFSWGWLADTSMYNNHFYLYSLIGAALLCMDAGRWGKLRVGSNELGVNSDELRVATSETTPNSQLITPNSSITPNSEWVPGWQVWTLRFFVWMAYFYGAVAKVNPDWLAGYPMKLWLPGRPLPVSAEWLDALFRSDGLAYFFTYAGLGFDAVVPFLLFVPALRRWVLAPIIFFHVTNSFVWQIGTFPWTMIGLTALFFPGAPRKAVFWVRRAWARVRNVPSPTRISRWVAPAGAALQPATQRRVAWVLGVFVGLQLLLPFRHWLYPGHVDWTGEGHYFAWRMMLVQANQNIAVHYRIPPETQWRPIILENYLYKSQVNQFKRQPDHLIRFTNWWMAHVADSLALPPDRQPEIRLHVFKSVNGRPYAPVFSPDSNFAAIHRPWLCPTPFYLPFNDSLPPGSY